MSEVGAVIDAEAESEQLFVQLERLLELQIQLVQRGDFSAVAAVGQKADGVAGKIASLSPPEQNKHTAQRLRLKKLYRKLSFMIGIEKKCTMEQLTQLHSGNRLLSTYKSNA